MKMTKLSAAILAGLVIAGCGKDATDSKNDDAVLSVNGAVLTRGMVENDVAAVIAAQGDKIPAEQLEYMKQMIQNQVAQSFIVENVLVSKAKAEGFVVTDADRAEREAEFIKSVSRMPDAPKTLQEYFEKFPLGADRAKKEFENGILIDKMIKDAQTKASPSIDYAAKADEIIANIVSNNATVASSEADALTKIQALKAELSATPVDQIAAKFGELAKAHSDCPSGKRANGDLGEFTHGMMVKEFDEVAFALPVGQVSDPVKTDFGYHLIMVTKKIAPVEAQGDQPAEPEKVQASHILIKAGEARPVPERERVIDALKKQDERMFVQGFLLDQIKNAKIEAFDDDYQQFVPPTEEAPSAEGVETAE